MSPSHTSSLGWRETSNQCYRVGWLLPPIAALTVSVHLCFWLLGCSKLCCLSDTFESFEASCYRRLWCRVLTGQGAKSARAALGESPCLSIQHQALALPLTFICQAIQWPIFSVSSSGLSATTQRAPYLKQASKQTPNPNFEKLCFFKAGMQTNAISDPRLHDFLSGCTWRYLKPKSQEK